MITSGNRIALGERVHGDLAVIGAGPAGIVSALEASRRGIDVILIETGNGKQSSRYQRLSVVHKRHPDLHAPVELTVSRQLGGTSAIWGGKCVPYDHIDFIERDITPDSKWPVTYEDLHRYFERACDWMACGRAVFDVKRLNHLPKRMIPELEDGIISTSSLERWSLPTNFGKVYFKELRDSANLRVITEATCVRINLDGKRCRASHLNCKTLAGRSFTVSANEIIVATGGLEATRLLMCSPDGNGKSIGDHSGHLGHWYMAHMEGVIADLVLSTPAENMVYAYERDLDGSYVRRRFAFAEDYLLEHGLPNISGWITNPELSDASHHNARLSFIYLALISPLGFLFAPPAQRLSLTGTKIPGTPYGKAVRSPVWAHLSNILREPLETLRLVSDFGVKWVLSRGRKPPGFFVSSSADRYPFQYHGEHLPCYYSCVRLSEELDDLGMPKLDIDIRFRDLDIDGVIAAHRHWDSYFRAAGVGRLEYLSKDLTDLVNARTGGGFHQIGTTRMSKNPQDGVVDENLAVHAVPNLHVVSSSVFVTSSQANPTFMVVVFAIRLIERLYGKC
jgi:hypothetical protein